MRSTGFAESTPPFRGRERTAVDIDVCSVRRSPHYHETCLALESVEELETKARRGDGEYGRVLTEKNEGFYSKYRDATKTERMK